MRRVALTLWHSSLILIMVWGLLTALVAAARRLTLTWYAPGITTLGLIIALEAIITQRLAARERRRVEEQIGLRGLEFAILIVFIRLWSLPAELDPLLQTITPWLRSPLEFFGGRFGEYFLWSLVAWVAATMLASDVLDWNVDEQAVYTIEGGIERDQLQHEWGQIVARYDRRYLLIVLVTCAASAFAIHGANLDPNTSVSWRLPTVAAMGSLVAGLLLHSAGKLSQLRRNWSVDAITVDPGLAGRWSRPGLLLVAALVLLSPLLGWLVLVAPPPPLVPIANFILGALTIIISVLFLLLLSPLILLLSLLRGGGAAIPTQMPFRPPQIPDTQPGERPLLPALIFWGCIVLLIAIAVSRYLRERGDLAAALRRWRIGRWLLALQAWMHGWWSDARGWAGMAVASVRHMVHRKQRSPRRARPVGARAQLRAFYRQMKRAGARRGIRPRRDETPYEYGAALSRELPAVGGEVRGLTEAYVQAEYGPRPVGPGDVQRARRHWRRLQRWLLRSTGLRPRGRP